jgi:hypothetical protein
MWGKVIKSVILEDEATEFIRTKEMMEKPRRELGIIFNEMLESAPFNHEDE